MRRLISHISIFGFIYSLLTMPMPAYANPLDSGTSTTGQPGVMEVLSATPSISGSWGLSFLLDVGWQPNAIEEEDVHQSSLSRLILAYAPWTFLQIGLSAEGTVESYTSPDLRGSNMGGSFGNPRLSLRTGFALGSVVSLGVLAEVLFPTGIGSNAFEWSSVSPAARLMVSATPSSIPLGVHFDVGYEHDRTAQALGDTSGYTADQLLLSAASSLENSFVLGLAVEYRIALVAPYIELGSQIMLDSAALEHSPVLVAAGARLWFGPDDAVQLLLGMRFNVNAPPPVPNPETGTIINAPPLLGVQVTLSVRLPIRVAAEEEEEEEGGGGGGRERPRPTRGRRDAPAESETTLSRITGTLRCDGEPCHRDARLSLPETDSSSLVADEDGRFSTAPLTLGTYTLEVSAPGFESQSQTVTLGESGPTLVEINLVPSNETEQTGIQGRVTNFDGEPIQATIRIPALDVELTTDDSGTFQTAAPPGQYDIIVTSRGFETQRIQAEVTPAGVVVVNAVLRRGR